MTTTKGPKPVILFRPVEVLKSCRPGHKTCDNLADYELRIEYAGSESEEGFAIEMTVCSIHFDILTRSAQKMADEGIPPPDETAVCEECGRRNVEHQMKDIFACSAKREEKRRTERGE